MRDHRLIDGRPRLIVPVVLWAACLLFAVGCGDDGRALPGAFPPEDGASVDGTGDRSGAVSTTRVASVGEMVTALISDPERDALFVGTRAGRIVRVPIEQRDGATVPASDRAVVAADLSGSVSTEDERGFFDMAVLADGEHVAVSYTATDGAVTVRLLRLDGTELVDDVENPTVVAIPHPFAGHNGGGLALVAGGDLLLSVGDMDSREFELPYAQDPESLLGGIVRIPAAAFSRRELRPVAQDPSLLVAKGLRNPWRISVDADRDDLWIGDVGQDGWEEINRLAGVSPPSELVNLGWPLFEADEPFLADAPQLPDAPIVAPVHAYPHSETRCSISLGHVYRGEQLPHLAGHLLFGDLCSGEVSALDVRNGRVGDTSVIAEVPGAVVSFGQDAFGETYVLTVEGDVYRLDPAGWSPPDAEGTRLPSQGGGPTSTEAPAATSEECEVIDLLEANVQTLPPEQMRQHLAGLISTLERAAISAPPERRDDLQVLVEVFEELDVVGERAGYSASDPELTALMAELMEGSGRAEGFPDAITSIMTVAGTCP